MVELVANGNIRSFDISHAERILRNPSNGGWKLPENSRFTFTYEDGIIVRENNATTGKVGKSTYDTSSDEVSE